MLFGGVEHFGHLGSAAVGALNQYPPQAPPKRPLMFEWRV